MFPRSHGIFIFFHYQTRKKPTRNKKRVVLLKGTFPYLLILRRIGNNVIVSNDIRTTLMNKISSTQWGTKIYKKKNAMILNPIMDGCPFVLGSSHAFPLYCSWVVHEVHFLVTPFGCTHSDVCISPSKSDQRVPNSSSLLFHMLLQILSSFQLYSWVKREELYNSKQNLLFWGASIVSIFLVMGQSNWLTTKKKKKRFEIGRHLI